MKLNKLPSTSVKKQKRLGRGYGSGVGGHTVGRGTKGQRSRTGKGIPLWFEGGQLPVVKKLPYLRGKARFQTLNAQPQLITLTQLNKVDATEINPGILKTQGFIRYANRPVKVTGIGKISRVVTLQNIRVTASAKAAVEKAGGSVKS